MFYHQPDLELLFDGHVFRWPDKPGIILGLYLAAKARRGDTVAIELLNALDVPIRTKDGKVYWDKDTPIAESK